MPRKKKNVMLVSASTVERVQKHVLHFHYRECKDGSKLIYLDFGNKYRDYNLNKGKRYEPIVDDSGNRLYLRSVRLNDDGTENAADVAHNEYAAAAAIEKRDEIEDIINNKNGKRLSKQEQELRLCDWVSICADKIAEDGSTYSRSTRKYAYLLVRDMLEAYGGKRTKLAELDGNDSFVRGFIDYLRNEYMITRCKGKNGQHLHPNTAALRYKVLVAVLNRAVEAGYIKVNPCTLISKRDKIKSDYKQVTALTVDELQRMADTPMTSPRTRRVFFFMVYTGLRISDVKTLRWGDIEKNGEGWWLTKRLQKTDENNTISMPDDALQYLPQRGEKSVSELVFDDIPTEPAMNRALKNWAEAAGVSKRVTLHVARHTLGTLLIEHGATLYDVQGYLGHSTPEMTKVYAEMTNPRKAVTASRMNGIIKNNNNN